MQSHTNLLPMTHITLPAVVKFVSVEMIRDGGSFAAVFESDASSDFCLFLPLRDTHPTPSDKQQFDSPYIIDFDPAKRPRDTATRIYSRLSGPATPLSWQQARQLFDEISRRAQGLDPFYAEWLKDMANIIAREGRRLPLED